MLEAASDPCLAEDSQRRVDVAAATLQRLDCDVTPQRGLRGEMDDAHPALADRLVDIELTVE